jgi:hypothetical protein
VADVTKALTRKLGPLPAWVWLGGAGALAFILLRGRKGATGTTQNAAAASGSPLASGYGLGYAQGLQASQAAAPAQMQQVPTTGQFRPGASGSTVWNGNQYRWVVTGPSQGVPEALQQLGLNSSDPNVINRLTYFTPNPRTDQQGNTVWYMGLLDPNGRPLPTPSIWPPPYSGPPPPGMGGSPAIGGPMRKHHVGSRSAHEWHDAHPAIGAKVLYPHYVRAVGGPGRHAAEIHRVARQAGVHPARVLMLNPTHTGRIRVA